MPLFSAQVLGSFKNPRHGGAPLPVLARLIIAKKVAASMFWDMLADFVSLNLCPTDWLPAVPLQHPLIGVQIGPTGQRTLVFCRH